jgi:hypothetical protein
MRLAGAEDMSRLEICSPNCRTWKEMEIGWVADYVTREREREREKKN